MENLRLMKFLNSVFLVLFFIPLLTFGQQENNPDHIAYINKYRKLAIREMQLYKIPASITLAQGIIESSCGKSVLTKESLNHFGIKCQKEWTGETYYYDDDKANECFRKYNNVNESYRDHSLFLTSRPRYASLFTLAITDYKGWAYGLRLTGYATNPAYADILIRTIEANQLNLLDDSVVNGLENTVLARQEEPGINRPDSLNEALPAPESYLSNSGRILFRGEYEDPDPAAFPLAYTSKSGRKVYKNNGVPFIFAEESDTWYSIAKEFGIYSFQIYKQNDLSRNDQLIKGKKVYLEPKRKRNPAKTYKVKPGDCLYSVSQDLGIRLKDLVKYNIKYQTQEPEPGDILHLKSTTPRIALFR